MAGSGSPPDLQSVLATLAQFAPPAQRNEYVENLDRGSTPGSTGQPSVEGSEPEPGPSPPAIASEPRLRPQSRSSNASPRPMIDPATITTWQEGLRCVTKIAAQNAQFATSIKRMIQDQRKHEMQWYSERQSLKSKQAKRASSSAQAQSILQSLNKSTELASPKANTSDDVEAELNVFDRKIYAAQLEMEATMMAELKGLGVPFFGTNQDLILSNDSESTNLQPLPTQPKWSPKITQDQLLELRRRMVQHLEDLYRD